ncbi:hypothetical protein LEP1GSC170_2210 [Leptospira interrogans serovar Bataviae str. HAI135]|nr:hypothetical protein LEP1GSC170_2210 [Leptospira interrogans serovar Bataviae str. HAI135]
MSCRKTKVKIANRAINIVGKVLCGRTSVQGVFLDSFSALQISFFGPFF